MIGVRRILLALDYRRRPEPAQTLDRARLVSLARTVARQEQVALTLLRPDRTFSERVQDPGAEP